LEVNFSQIGIITILLIISALCFAGCTDSAPSSQGGCFCIPQWGNPPRILFHPHQIERLPELEPGIVEPPALGKAVVAMECKAVRVS
jgi:hypothetical protein